MALVRTGTFTRSGGLFASVKKHLNDVNLKPAKKVTIRFDPFGPNSVNLRQFINSFSHKKVLQTNPYCRIFHEVICDRSEPTVDVLLKSGKSVKLKCAHLSILDIIKIFNIHVSCLEPKDQIQNTVTIKIKRR